MNTFCMRLLRCQYFLRFVLFVFFLIFIRFPLSAQEIISLRAAIDSTMKNNLQIRQADFQSALGSQDVLQSRMNFLPSLSTGVSGRLSGGNFFDEKTGTISNTTNKSIDGDVSSSVTLFQGFQRINQIAYNKYLLEADKSEAERVRNDLQLSVFTTYMEALTNRDLLEASEQQLKLSQDQLAVEEVNMEVGNRTLADLSQARSQVATDELNVTSANNAYELSILSLKQLMEMSPSREIVLEVPSIPDVEKITSEYSAQEVYSNAVKLFPEISEAEFNTLAAERNIKISKGAYYPTLSLSGGLGSGYTTSYRDMNSAIFPFREQIRNNFSQYIGFSLNIPIFNNFSSRIGVRKAKISYENTKVAEQQVKNDLNKVVNQAVLDLHSAEQRYQSSEQAFIAMRETFNVYKKRYEVGLANAIELSTSQTNMNKAEFDFITSKYNLIFRSKVIDFYLGKQIEFP